jgi:hypothetical protein
MPLRRSAKDSAIEDLTLFSTTMVSKRGEIRVSIISRSREKPVSFIEGVVVALPPSTSGSDHRSTAGNSQTTTSHREKVDLHHG